MMTKRLRVTLGSIVAVMAFGLGCSTDSPTAPVQTPAPPPGTGTPSAQWNIEVSVSPDVLTINDSQPATVTVTIRRADNNQLPPSGTTIVLSTSLGDLQSSGSGVNSTALETIGGRASVLLFAGSVTGRALVSAQLEASVGQRTIEIMGEIEPIQAAFAFQNSENNLSVTFVNLSTGDPTDFLWEFGDGTTSTEENPSHVFPYAGDFVVSLTASKEGASDKTSQIILVGEILDLVADFEFTNSEDNLSVKFLNTSTGDPTSFSWNFGDGTTSSEENPDHIFPAAGDYVVSLTVRRDGLTDEVSKFVTVGKPTELFIDFLSPATGPEGGGTIVTITGSGFEDLARVFFGPKLGEVLSVSPSTITVRTPPGDVSTVSCEVGGAPGTKDVDTPVPVTVETEQGKSETLANAFTYIADDSVTCNP